MAYNMFNFIIDIIGLMFYLAFVNEFFLKMDKEKGLLYWIGLVISFIIFWIAGNYKLGLIVIALILSLVITDISDDDITIFKKIFNKIFKRIENKYDSNKNFAQEFKEAIEDNNPDIAGNILSDWNNNNDANYVYATIIFEGMPPTDLTITELNNWLNSARTMKAKDESLREWYESTALEVVSLNNNN